MHNHTLTADHYFSHYAQTLNEITTFHPLLVFSVLAAPFIAASTAIAVEAIVVRRAQHALDASPTGVVLPFRQKIIRKTNTAA